MDKLQDITNRRREAVEQLKLSVDEAELKSKAQVLRSDIGPPLSLIARIYQDIETSGNKLVIAAEFKRASPSKGMIATHHTVKEQVQSYVDGGATIISILTEEDHFQGSLDDLLVARIQVEPRAKAGLTRPLILRKDFIIDAYQLAEAYAYGADTVLLIVAILSPLTLQSLIDLSRNTYAMEPLVEVNNEQELELALGAGAKVIGVNNRNLRTFQLDLGTTERLASCVQLGPAHTTMIALSGISCRADVERYEGCGVQGVLVGETLMRTLDPIQHMHALLGKQAEAHSRKDIFVKICGITNPEDALIAARAGANAVGIIFVPNTPRCVSVPVAQAIVQAIRDFGERTERMPISNSKQEQGANLTPIEFWTQKLVVQTQNRPIVVGVFQNQSVEEIQTMFDLVGLDMIQLHGNESLAFCQDLSVRDIPLCRCLHMHPHKEEEEANRRNPPPSIVSKTIVENSRSMMILLDTSISGQRGGTGKVFDWTLASEFYHADIPVIMAGGLTSLNVTQAIEVGRPFGVDTSSGVELRDGTHLRKDPAQVQAFVKQARLG